MHYLEEIHALPAIKDIFSVHTQGGFRSFFKKDSRAEIVETVTMINFMLVDFITKFTKRRMAVLDWPMIEFARQVVHLIHCWGGSVHKLMEMKITPLWKIALKKRSDTVTVLAINSQEDIIALHKDEHRDHGLFMIKLDRANGEWKPFCACPSDSKTWCTVSATIDDDDIVYVVSKQLPSVYMLSVFGSDGTITHSACPLDFIDGDLCCITVTQEKNIVLGSEKNGKQIVSGRYKGDYCKDLSVYVCDKTGKLIKSSPSLLKNLHAVQVSMKSDDDIIVATYDDISRAVKISVFTKEGRHKRTIKLNSLIFDATSACQVTFDHVTKTYFVYIQSLFHSPILQCFSKTGELRTVFFLDIIGWGGKLFCHQNGAMTVVDAMKVYYLRSPK